MYLLNKKMSFDVNFCFLLNHFANIDIYIYISNVRWNLHLFLNIIFQHFSFKFKGINLSSVIFSWFGLDPLEQ